MDRYCKECVYFPCMREECDIFKGHCNYGKSIVTFVIEELAKESGDNE